MKTSCKSQKSWIETNMKELNLVILVKSELQHQGNWKLIALFGIPSMWGSRNDIIQQKYFRRKFVFSDPWQAGKLDGEEDCYQKAQKTIQITTLIFTLLNRFIHFLQIFKKLFLR